MANRNEEDDARNEASALALKIIKAKGDQVAGEMFRGYIRAFAHNLDAVRPDTFESAELLYTLADIHTDAKFEKLAKVK